MNDYINVTMTSPGTTWAINCDGLFKQKVAAQLLNDDIPQDAVDEIFQNSVNILSQCPNPNAPSSSKRTGIVIGKVQSGKTSNFISVLALAFDNQYNLAIVLGGNKLPLLKQNTERIRSYFQNISEDRIVILSTKENAQLLNADNISQFIAQGKKVIIVGLKHVKHITAISAIFNKISTQDIPTIIVDDEGDQATPNANTTGASTPTYSEIIRLKNKIERHCFLSITATPQANILISTVDLLSPDFGVLIQPNDSYCGLEVFHGCNSDTFIKTIINDLEPSLLDRSAIPISFYRALAAFFTGGAIRQYRGDNGRHAMLIHPSQKKIDHNQVVKKVQKLLNTWQEKATQRLEGVNDVSYQTLQKHLVDAYDAFKQDGVSLPNYEELEEYILKAIKDCSPVFICNSSENATENAKFYKYTIFVGGNMVERGLTIRGLAITYIMRRANGVANVDTTEQRARWFGYKRNYIDVCRVYTTQAIADDFSSIYGHDEDLWTSIVRAQQNGTPFKEIPRIFKLANMQLRMTRTSVASADRLCFSEWNQQTKLASSKINSQKNNEIIAVYRDMHSHALSEINYSPRQTHIALRNIDYDEVYDNMLSKLIYPDSGLDCTDLLKIKTGLQKAGIKGIIDILWMRDGTGEERSLYSNDKIKNLLQGSNAETGDPTFYPGDRHLVDTVKMQLQIHTVRPRNREDINWDSAVFALYIPTVYNTHLIEIVGQI